MPSIPGIPGAYRFYFYSFDCGEPMHVHVVRERLTCKFWLGGVGGERWFHAEGTQPYPCPGCRTSCPYRGGLA
jgi:hypothetical protein